MLVGKKTTQQLICLLQHCLLVEKETKTHQILEKVRAEIILRGTVSTNENYFFLKAVDF